MFTMGMFASDYFRRKNGAEKGGKAVGQDNVEVGP